MDGAGAWQRFRYVTMPLMRRSIVLVTTLALIGSWQVFDQVYIMTQGAPAKTTITPAYLSYAQSFADGRFGRGAAVAFVLFLIIMVFNGVPALDHQGAKDDRAPRSSRCPVVRRSAAWPTASSSSGW